MFWVSNFLGVLQCNVKKSKFCVLPDHADHDDLLGSLDLAYLFAYAVGMFLRYSE